MKLRWIRIKGFRSIREVEFDVDDFLCFIGQNNHGKSNIFQALNLFFSSGKKMITPDLFFRSQSQIAEEIIIEARFEDLSSAEMEKLKYWTVKGKLTILKRYWIDNGSPQISYEALMEIPQDEWLREDFENYSERGIVSNLPIAEFIPDKGRITKQIYKDAIQSYIDAYSNRVNWVEERLENPAGYKQVLDGYLPEFNLVPAVRDITEETKTKGTTLLSRLLNVIVSRIAQQNPEFQRLQEIVHEIKILIEGKTADEKLDEIRELEEKLKQELCLWDVGLNICIEAPDVEQLFLGTYITVDDGIPTGVDEKGHGLQRSMIFALMRVWADEMRRARSTTSGDIRERSHIFAFEEPELFLHPQMCRVTYDSLKNISETDQILICTHSPHFIDIEDYPHIVIVRKPSLDIGTTVQYVQDELFEGEEKKQFDMTRYFNPDRNELFFARKVVLVEGDTEKVILPLIAKRIDVFDHPVSIINCGGKFNLKLFVMVLNAFRIHYLVIYDEDPIDPDLLPGGSKHDPDTLRSARKTFNENEKIRETCDPQVGIIKIIPNKFEDLLGISKNQIKKYGKPLAAFRKYDNEHERIPQHLEELVRDVYS